MKQPLLAIVLAMTLVAPLGASDALKAMVDSYLKIHAALAGDAIEGVKEASLAIAAQAARAGTEGEPLKAAAQKLADASTLESAREAFGTLTDELIKRGNAEGWKDVPDAKLAYCPMVKKSWIQKGDKIENPYYGSAMLTCGAIKK